MVQVNVETVIMFGDVASSVRKAFDENGSGGCSLICETEDGERVIFEAAGTLSNRAVALNTVRKVFRRLKAARYVRVTRYWIDPTNASIHPLENANCREGIMILSVDNTSVRMRCIAEIKRSADGKVTLGPWEPIEISDGWLYGLVELVRGCRG
jgi:hypothetical protein